MKKEMLVHLHKLKFYGYHGLLEDEKVLGGAYEVDLSVKFEPGAEVVTGIQETVDYTTLYKLVRERMGTPALLLETLATGIAVEIIAKFSMVNRVEISIAKLHPPIINFEGSVGVTYTLQRD